MTTDLGGKTVGPVESRHSRFAVVRTVPGLGMALDGGFWGPRLAVNRDAALPHGLRMLGTAGNLDNLKIAAGRSAAEYRGPVFMDSDVYKWLEAASYEVARVPSEHLVERMESVIELVAAAQQPDGYVNSYYQVVHSGARWIDFPRGHELYCAGHLIQAAVAHRRGTGGGRLLDIAVRFADYLVRTFDQEGRPGIPGHPEIETALVELYRETGARAYLDLAGAFLDRRGYGWLGPGAHNSSAHYQDRVPVRESAALEGHAVRAQYLTAGVADVYLETGDAALLQAVTRQWTDLVARRIYLTGAVGSRHLSEAVGQPYELTSELAYGETCAAIASFMWAWRMLLATGEASFAEQMERTLYNAILSGLALDGVRYFYVNPLSSNGQDEVLSRGGCRRREWHLVACCPPNLMRLLASLGHYVVTRDASGLQLHQYAAGRIDAEFAPGRRVRLRVDSGYPHTGDLGIAVDETDGEPWTLAIRAPRGAAATIRVNEAVVDAAPDGGYLRLRRPWRRGDTVDVRWAIDAHFVEPHPWIESTGRCVAIERGPFVYCIEQTDQPAVPIGDIMADVSSPLESEWAPELLGGVMVVRGKGARIDGAAWGDTLYRPVGTAPAPRRRRVALTAIPYYAWANREQGAMRVWVPRM